MQRIYLLLAALLSAAPVHADTINAFGDFTIEWWGGDDGAPLIDPPYIGTGFIDMRENRIAAFRFEMLGYSWDIHDIPRYCPQYVCQPGTLWLEFGDEQGHGLMAWDLGEQVFGFIFEAGPYSLFGTNGVGSVYANGVRITSNLPEPGTLALLGFGLIVLVLVRRLS